MSYVSLSDICIRKVQITNPKEEPERQFQYIDISAVDNQTKRIVSPQYVYGKNASVRARRVVKENDVIVSTTRPNLNAVALVSKDMDGQVCSTGFCVLRAIPEYLDHDYLFCFVRSSLFIRSLSDLVQGALYPAVTDKQVFSQKIPLPSLAEQKRIAAQLKTQLAEVEKTRLALEQQYVSAEVLSQKIIDELYTSSTEKKSIGDFASVQSGFAFKSKDFTQSGIRLMRNANIRPGQFDWSDTAWWPEENRADYVKYELENNDLLISLDRPIISTGIKVVKVTRAILPSLLVQRVGRFQFFSDAVLPDYLFGFLLTSQFRDHISGHDHSIGVPHISPSQIAKIQIPAHPLSKQHEVVDKLNEATEHLQKAKTALAASRKDVEILPSKLLEAAFSG